MIYKFEILYLFDKRIKKTQDVIRFNLQGGEDTSLSHRSQKHWNRLVKNLIYTKYKQKVRA